MAFLWERKGWHALVMLFGLSSAVNPPCSAMFLLCVAGAGLSGRQMHRTQGVFNHTEDYVLLPDERTISLCCWDSRTAERKNLLSLGHNNIVRCIVHSPTNPGFMTCSDDFRARFWYRRTTTDWDTASPHVCTLPLLQHHLTCSQRTRLDAVSMISLNSCFSPDLWCPLLWFHLKLCSGILESVVPS